jgi:ketosteroid isomerase-like protein
MDNLSIINLKMRKGLYLMFLFSFLALVLLPQSVNAEQKEQSEFNNKKIIVDAFNGWTEGTGNFFDLLDDNVEWTITGNTQFAKTYIGRQQFINEVIVPLNKRLKVKIVPTVLAVYEDGNTVIVRWDGTATANDGITYTNNYAWFMTMSHGKIVKVTAFFDAADLVTLFKRVPPENS